MKRRWAFRICVLLGLLVGGAIINVAVAWIIVDSRAEVIEFPGSYGPGSSAFGALAAPGDQGRPFHSVTARQSTPNHDSKRASFFIGQLELPARPIWPGFAINTVFYAVIIWLFVAAPLALRRLRRIKRGLCSTCAYDLRGTPHDATACPECGAMR